MQWVDDANQTYYWMNIKTMPLGQVNQLVYEIYLLLIRYMELKELSLSILMISVVSNSGVFKDNI